MICNVLRIFDLQEKKPRICEGLSCRLYILKSKIIATGIWNAKISVNTKYSLNLTIELN